MLQACCWWSLATPPNSGTNKKHNRNSRRCCAVCWSARRDLSRRPFLHWGVMCAGRTYTCAHANESPSTTQFMAPRHAQPHTHTQHTNRWPRQCCWTASPPHVAVRAATSPWFRVAAPSFQVPPTCKHQVHANTRAGSTRAPAPQAPKQYKFARRLPLCSAQPQTMPLLIDT